MQDNNEILEKYASAFRELVNARVWEKDEHPKETLRLNRREDWSFICVAMDIVGDVCLALENFFEFGLDGPARYDSVGERYLRLYGVLSAAYIQQQAILKLYGLMNCADPQRRKSELDALRIRILRHQLASHSLDYMEPRSGGAEGYVPVRIGLRGFSCTITRGRGDSSEDIDLREALIEHCRACIGILDAIFEKSIYTIFKGQENKIAEFEKVLVDLRFERDGNRIMRVKGEEKDIEIRVAFVEPRT